MQKMTSKIKAVLIDLSGTIHIDNQAIEGAIEAVNRLKASSLKYRFVTNTTKESQNVLLNRLHSLGFDISKKEIFTSLIAAKDLIRKLDLNPFLLIDDAAFEDFSDIKNCNDDPSKGNAVVVGLAPEKFNYTMMCQAFNMLLRGAKLIAVHKSRYFKGKEGLKLGPGAFVTALEFASDVKSTVVGKPEKQFFLSALEQLNCKPEEAVMIGDDARDDVGGAQEAGILGILVKTGKYLPGDEAKINPAPNYVMNSFVEAVDFVLKNFNS